MAEVGLYGDGGGDGGGDSPYDVGTRGGPITATDPSQRDNTDSYNTVAGYYQSLLGRAPENSGVVNSWLTGSQGHLDQIYSGIAASPEAKAYAAAHSAAPAPTAAAAPAATGGSDQERINALLQKYQSTDDPNYWYGIVAQHGGFDATGAQWLEDRIMHGDGAAGVRNGTVQKFQDGPAAGPAGPTPGGYTDDSSKLYLNQVMQRLNQVQQPQDNSIFDLLKTLATAQATKLQQAPYTPADDAALITQYRDPLNTARDTAKQQAALDLSRRGIGPTSGVYQDRMKQIDVAYEKGIAQGANQMGVNAVAQKNANAMQALQILSSLSSANNTQIDRSNAMADQSVNLAKMFPDFDAARLDQLLRASSDNGASSAISNLTSLGNLNLNTIGMNNNNDAANSAAWGKLIASILGSASY